MSKKIIIDSHPWEKRVAILEEGDLAELYIERPKNLGVLGNIYKGKVIRVLPGMEAAFVDIGLDKGAFLYLTDFYDDFDEFEDLLERYEGSEDAGKVAILPGGGLIGGSLRRGQDVLVQVSREPLGGKGARITSHISLPGRYLVLLPTMDRVGVSKRIDNNKERKRLKDIIEKIRPSGFGFIVRTAGSGASEKGLSKDMDFLLDIFKSIIKKKESTKSPCLIYREFELPLRVVRDLLDNDIDKLLINSEEEYKRIRDFASSFIPGQLKKIELYMGSEPIFDQYGLEAEIKKALEKKVWLKSGGYIVLEVTEALSAIDVNTGKFVGTRDLEDTIFKTNLEAVREIAKQVRLRNIGGLIVIDFIDMEKIKNREKVYKALDEALKNDKKKTNILKVSELGIVEMTRKRTRENLTQILTDSCPICDGRGYINSSRTICYHIFREIIRGSENRVGNKVTVMVNPEVAGLLYDEERRAVEELEESLGKRIAIRAVEDLHVEEYDISYG